MSPDFKPAAFRSLLPMTEESRIHFDSTRVPGFVSAATKPCEGFVGKWDDGTE